MSSPSAERYGLDFSMGVNMQDSLNHVGDAAAALVVVGTISQILPAIAALFTIIWMGIRIYESDTIQKLIHGKGKDAG
jgi:hypothetical protein